VRSNSRRRALLAAAALAVRDALAQGRPAKAQPDPSPRWLTITVRTERPSALQPGAAVRTPNGATITENRSASASNARDGSTVIRTASSDQMLRVREGEPALIQFEAAVPMRFRHFEAGKGGVDAVRGVVTYDAVRSFAMRTRVRGNAVRIDIEPQDAQPFDATDRTKGAPSVQGQLGDWIAVGGADARGEGNPTTTDGSLRAQTRPATSQRGVWLKVELEALPAR
jgi:hypothetical protein